MKQAFEASLALQADSEIGHLHYGAALHVADMKALRDIGEPGIAAQLLEAQADALLLWFDLQNHAAHRRALGEHFLGVSDLANPAHVVDVQEAIDALRDFEESS